MKLLFNRKAGNGIILAAAIVWLASSPSGAYAATLSSIKAFDAGFALWKQYGCYECHGQQGRGSANDGPAIVPMNLPVEAFNVFVRTPANVMPPYSEQVLPKEDLERIYQYLKQIKPPRHREDVPELR